MDNKTMRFSDLDVRPAFDSLESVWTRMYVFYWRTKVSVFDSARRKVFGAKMEEDEKSE